MKKIILIFSFLSFFTATEISYAQAVQNSWSFGFGFSYPRFQSTNVRPQQANYGGYLSLQRNFTEHLGLRILANYSRMKGRVGGSSPTYFYNTTPPTPVPSMTEYTHTTIFTGNLDMLYYFVPCSPVDPYFGAGIGVGSEDPVWPNNIINASANSSNITSQFNFFLGSEWKVASSWNLKTEFGWHVTDNKLDGSVTYNRSGVLGSNAEAYITMNVGLQYYFSKGAPSKYCDLYNGIEAQAPKQNYPTLDEIESLIEKYIPAEIEKQVVVQKPVTEKAHWILYGVNFEFNKSSLLPEAYPILTHAVQILKENGDMKVQIEGYTDNVGSKKYNQKLSEQRANIVKDFLVKQGIDGSRLSTIGYGESNPVGDNSSAIGRAENRRIEFKILK